jgi:hypothetical protein
MPSTHVTSNMPIPFGKMQARLAYHHHALDLTSTMPPPLMPVMPALTHPQVGYHS